MLMVRKTALKVLPLLVVLWATVAIMGGAFHLVNETKAAQDAAVKTGLGLCAVSVALLMSTSIRRKVTIPGPIKTLLRRNPPSPCTTMRPEVRDKPPSVGPQILHLLQVSRT